MPRAARSSACRIVVVAVGLLLTTTAGAASRSAPPVGPLPPGPSATIDTRKGELVAVALPRRAGGRVWRIARTVDARVVEEVAERDVGPGVVVVFKATGRGRATLYFALTRGETAKAYESRRVTIRVR